MTSALNIVLTDAQRVSYPLVSILIPAYNAEKWIEQCIESALGQSYANKEVIVGDDGSTDSTIDKIRQFGDRIVFVQFAHAGANAVRNRLTQMAQGEWLQYLDSDDYLLPNKIEDQIGFVRNNEWQFDAVYSPVIIRQEKTGAEYAYVVKPPYDDATVQFLRWVSFCTHGILLRRSAVLEVGCWKDTQPVCQEHELLFRLFTAGKAFGLWNQMAAVYRYHSTDTVSKKNPLRTMQVRMEITDRFEAWLKETRGLTREHRKELYIVRIETARIAWAIELAYAHDLVRTAEKEGRFWIFSRPAIPLSFQLVSRLCGFHTAQKLARFTRGIRGKLRLGPQSS